MPTKKNEPKAHEVAESRILADAEYMTAVRGRGASRTVVRCADMAEAEALAATHDDGRTMIYAVTSMGDSAHIKNA